MGPAHRSKAKQRGERPAEYIDGMNIPEGERTHGGQGDEHPGLQGRFQHHEPNARGGGRETTPRDPAGNPASPDQHYHDLSYEPTSLVQMPLRGQRGQAEPHPHPENPQGVCAITSTTTTDAGGQDEERQHLPGRPSTNHTRGQTRAKGAPWHAKLYQTREKPGIRIIGIHLFRDPSSGRVRAQRGGPWAPRTSRLRSGGPDAYHRKRWG